MRSPFRAAAAIILVGLLSATGCATSTGGSGGGGGTPTTTTTTPPTDYTKCPAVAAGQVRVAMVVDATALGSAAPSVVCVVVAQGANGIVALNARATRLGTTPPRFDASGLLCAIDGAPVAPACGVMGPNGYEFWTYWLGGTSWAFAPVGPASRHVQDGTVEGWRFVRGGASVAPATSATFAQLVS